MIPAFMPQHLAPYMKVKKYLGGRFPILYQEPADLKYIEISDNRIRRNPVVVSDKTQLESFKDALRRDINKLGYNELISQSQRVLYIDIMDNEDRVISYDIRSSFTNTINWLKSCTVFH